MKIMFVFAPTSDPRDKFFHAAPTSLMHAITPLVTEIDNGKLTGVSYHPAIFCPKQYNALVEDSFRTLVLSVRPDVLLCGSTYDSWRNALLLSAVAKAAKPGLVTIHGGPYLDEVLSDTVLRLMPRLNPFAELANSSNIDFAMSGDAEYAIVALVQMLASLGIEKTVAKLVNTPHGLAVPGRGAVTFTNEGQFVKVRYANSLKLGNLPYIRRSLAPDVDYRSFHAFTQSDGTACRTATVLSHRGCRSRCNFCSEGEPYNARPHEHILGEIEALKRSGFNAVFFDDSTFQDDNDWHHLLSRAAGVDMRFGFLTRFDHLTDRSLLSNMRRFGLEYVYASIEQMDNRSLKMMNKMQQEEHIRAGVMNLKEAGIRLGVSLLFGLPDETKQSVMSTLQFVRDCVEAGSIQFVSMSLFSYHPRTLVAFRNREMVEKLRFDTVPPNLGYPFNNFEEGQWYHPPHVTFEYVAKLYADAENMFGHALVRNIDMTLPEVLYG